MTSLPTHEVMLLRGESDLPLIRQVVKERACAMGFSTLDQTKIVTVASELGRNTLVHGGGGSMSLETITEGARTGIRLIFEDQGRGIADIDQAMTDGFSTVRSMGHGLGGSKRLMHDFEIVSNVGQGTRVTATRWI